MFLTESEVDVETPVQDMLPGPAPVIEAREVGKSFGEVEAVRNLSFSVGAGEIFGLLGPNGAGKSTAIRMLTTLIAIDSGSGIVGGFDVRTHPDAVRQMIGLAGQAAAIDEKLSARENLELFGRLYKVPRTLRRQRIGHMIERFAMTEFADRPAGGYSGGERRRLDVVAALIGDPIALFLDEPTTGLDPRSRNEIWDAVRSFAAQGTAIVLTTQYLEEADHLADKVLVIDKGSEVASGSPAQLKKELGGDVLEIHLETHGDLEIALNTVGQIESVVTNVPARQIDVPFNDGATCSLGLLRQIEDDGATISDFRMRRPTLDDVFLALTGSRTDSKGVPR